jgi:hypothetical protein
VEGVFPAKRAIFIDLQLFRLLFLVSGVGVVPPLALAAAQSDDFSHVQLTFWYPPTAAEFGRIRRPSAMDLTPGSR